MKPLEGYKIAFKKGLKGFAQAPQSSYKKEIHVSNTLRKKLTDKELRAVLYHELFHKKYNTSIILIWSALWILGVGISRNIFVLVAALFSIIPSIWILELCADIYSAKKNGKYPLGNAFHKLDVVGDWLHPSPFLRWRVINLFT